MEKRRNIIDTLNHYGIIVTLIITTIIYLLIKPLIIKPLILSFYSKSMHILNIKEDGIDILINLVIFIAIALIYILHLRNVIYHDKTGRSYATDHGKYHMTYWELVDVLKDADKHHLDKRKLPIEEWYDAEGVILGKVGNRLVKRKSDGEGNFALLGRPGDGKTTCQIVTSALRFSGSIFGFDAKSDITPWLKGKRKMKIFAPDNASESCHFDPFGGISKMTPTQLKSFIEILGYCILPDEKGENASFFVEGARDFWCGITLYLLERSPGISFIDVVHAILQNSYEYWVNTVIQENCEVAMDYIASYSSGNERNYGSQYNKLVTTLREFTNGDLPKLLDSKGDDVITPELLEQGYDVWIVIPQASIKLYSRITSVITQTFINYFMSRTDKSSGDKVRDILFLLDEFPQLSFQLETLTSAMETLRSKRVSLFLAMQSLAQIERKYGEVAAREIIDNCAYISCMSAQDPKSREFFSKLVGDRKILRVGSSDNSQTNGRNSYSHNVTPIWEPIYRPADFGNLNDKIVIVADGKYIEADKCRCYEDKAHVQANKQDESQTITIKYIIDKIFKRAE